MLLISLVTKGKFISFIPRKARSFAMLDELLKKLMKTQCPMSPPLPNWVLYTCYYIHVWPARGLIAVHSSYLGRVGAVAPIQRQLQRDYPK